MTFINADPIIEHLDRIIEGFRTEAATEERKAAANMAQVNQFRYATKVVESIKAFVEELMVAALSVEVPPPNPPETPGFTDCPPGCLHSESGPAPEEDVPGSDSSEVLEYDTGDVDPNFAAFITETMTPGPEPDTTPPTEEN